MPARRFLVLTAAVCAALALSACGASAAESGSTPAGGADLVRVPEDAATLADATAQVAPGGVIVLAAGTYEETMTISTPDVTVRGEDRNGTVIDGGGIRPYGIVAIADGVRVENLTVTGATFYGVLFTGLHDENGPSAPTANDYKPWDPDSFPPLERFLVDHVTAYNNGLYGIYAFNSRHGVIRNSYASGSADSGIYVGQCTDCDILVTGNVAERNAVGFENSNASDSVVITGNRFSGNRVGMTLLSSYQESFTPQKANQVVGNVVSDNNEPLSPAQADGAFGTGIGISGGVQNTIARNVVTGNAAAGVLLRNTEDLPATGNVFDGDVFAENGVDVANVSASRAPAAGNCAPAGLITAPAELAAQLTAACGGDAAPQAAASAPPSPEVPPGLSFKKVPPPAAQPNLDPSDSYDALPATIAMPDLAAIGVPDAALLIERTGTS